MKEVQIRKEKDGKGFEWRGQPEQRHRTVKHRARIGDWRLEAILITAAQNLEAKNIRSNWS